MNKLWKHQQYAVDKYKDRDYFGLLFPCGTGKTRTAIAIAEEKERPVLIIAPSVLCKQWEQDIQKDSTKDWEVVLCTSKTKHTKKFRNKLDNLCKE